MCVCVCVCVLTYLRFTCSHEIYFQINASKINGYLTLLSKYRIYDL